MKKRLRIRPLDPLITRDGRPFGETPGAVAHSMDEVSPSVVAGTIRTLLGKSISKSEFSSDIFGSRALDQIKKIVVRGPLYLRGERLFVPMPQDLDLYEEDESIKVSFRRPIPTRTVKDGFLGTGREGQFEDLLWVVSMLSYTKQLKKAPAYVSWDWMMRWLGDMLSEKDWSQALELWKLVDEEGGSISHESASKLPFMSSFKRDLRTHTAIDSNTYEAKDQALFTTEALVFPHDVSLLAEIEWPDELEWPQGMNAIHSMGGKRRLAHFSEADEIGQGSCPEELLSKLEGAEYVRMVLATPAYFAKGWLPGWLNQELKTTKEWSAELKLQLRWACVPRWQPISGWSYSKQEEKAVRRMVPAGSVYYFEVLNGNPGILARDLWLSSVSDRNRRKGAFDQDDGFGLALWGVWSPNGGKPSDT